MIDSSPPAAIVQPGDEFSRSLQHAMLGAEQLNLLRAEGVLASASSDYANTEKRVTKAIEKLDRIIRQFVDGDSSTEEWWRRICASAVRDFDGFVAAKDKLDDFFDTHLTTLRQIRENAGIRRIQELGYVLPAMSEIEDAIGRTEEIRDRILERWPLTRQEVAHRFPVDVDEVYYISPRAYVRSVFTIIWNAFRHPFTTTYIDLSTGATIVPKNLEEI